MKQRFQFSLGRLFVATSLVATAAGIYIAATRAAPPWSIVLFVMACAACGAAIGALFRQMLPAALLGFFAGIGFVIYAVRTSEL